MKETDTDTTPRPENTNQPAQPPPNRHERRKAAALKRKQQKRPRGK